MGGGGEGRRKKELDCIIDYPITSTALRNYPSPRQPVTHPERSPELQIHARLHTEDGEWPSEAKRRMAKSLVEPDETAAGVERGHTA